MASEAMGGGLACVVLAAGQGTRMRSELVKVLHPVLGRPMAAWPVSAALEVGAARVAVVVGVQGDAVREAVTAALPGHDLVFPVQEQPLGTGDAVRAAEAETEGCAELMVLCGDTPALDAATLAELRAAHAASGAALTVLTFEVDDPTGYGRMVRDGQGRLLRIVEHRDATDAERRIREVNAGVYLGSRELLFGALRRVGTDNDQGELYLTDVVALLAADGERVESHVLADPMRVAGINTRAQLAALEEAMLDERRQALMEAGVAMEAPQTIRVEHGVRVGRDVRLGGGVQLLEGTQVADGAHIEVGCVLRACQVGAGAHLKPYVVAEQTSFGAGAVAGPFAHLRPGTVLGDHTKIGNFVETKKATFGAGSKASHLSYIGDAEVGRDVNIGAGTITCNYDGTHKHRTVIEDGVFIGSDTQLVAPVRLGARAVVAAGTTVTKDVPAGALVLSRTAQSVREGYDERHRKPREAAKRAAKAASQASTDKS